ncbi:hypothetical protein OH76DRAFT_537056 [Lentinus brumalis]|uniref:Uncharacterized protein n=1 Tax=Lentinus brumalis TaxID=2498619 RepID=A0A371DAG8_9APHY|nr:hypothetical protein OH76DRAFT_537056 [Polyporus brumalis]
MSSSGRRSCGTPSRTHYLPRLPSRPGRLLPGVSLPSCSSRVAMRHIESASGERAVHDPRCRACFRDLRRRHWLRATSSRMSCLHTHPPWSVRHCVSSSEHAVGAAASCTTDLLHHDSIAHPVLGAAGDLG